MAADHLPRPPFTLPQKAYGYVFPSFFLLLVPQPSPICDSHFPHKAFSASRDVSDFSSSESTLQLLAFQGKLSHSGLCVMVNQVLDGLAPSAYVLYFWTRLVSSKLFVDLRSFLWVSWSFLALTVQLTAGCASSMTSGIVRWWLV